jgi:hypothetical protein
MTILIFIIGGTLCVDGVFVPLILLFALKADSRVMDLSGYVFISIIFIIGILAGFSFRYDKKKNNDLN